MYRTILIALTLTYSSIHFSPAVAQYYVVGRYQCIDNDSGDDSGDCVISTSHPDSCVAAFSAQRADIASRGGDPCRRCTPDITDNTQHWNQSVEWVQGGPCAGLAD